MRERERERERALFISFSFISRLQQVIANLNHTLGYDLNLAVQCGQLREIGYCNQSTLALTTANFK